MAGLDAKSSSPMTFEVAEDEPGALTVTLAGELDITNIEGLAEAVAPALERDPERMIVDVDELRFADSSAIALWVRWAAAVDQIELRGSSPLLRRVIESMGLSETLHVRA